MIQLPAKVPAPFNRATRLGINTLLLLAAGLAVHWCQSVFIPLVISVLLACVLGPAAVWLKNRLHIRWGLACIAVIFGLILFNLLVTFILSVSVLSQVRQLDRSHFKTTIEEFKKKVNRVFPMRIEAANAKDEQRPGLTVLGAGTVSLLGSPLGQGPLLAASAAIPDRTEINQFLARAARRERVEWGPTDQQIDKFLDEVGPLILKTAGVMGMEWLFKWFFILFLLFFLLLEGPMLTRRVVDIFGPSEELKAKAGVVLRDTAQQIRTYIVWRTIINFGLAFVIGIAFQIGGLQQAWTWAVLLAILNYIPYLGPFLAGLPPLVDGFVNIDFIPLLVLCAIYWGVIILEGYLIVPLVMGRSMDLNATTVMMACLFWELVWGMTGLFLAMPIMAGVKTVCYHVPGWWQWANLMSADELTPPKETEGDGQPDGRPSGEGPPHSAHDARAVGDASQKR